MTGEEYDDRIRAEARSEIAAELQALLDEYKPLHMRSNEGDAWQWTLSLFDDMEVLVKKLEGKAPT